MAKKKTKAGNGEGNIRLKNINGKEYWEGRLRLNGKRYSVYGKTEKECNQKLNRIKVLGPPEAKKEKLTLDVLLDQFLEEEVRPRRKESTYLNYKYAIENHLKPRFGKILLEDLARSDIQRFINQKEHELSPRTIRLIVLVLSMTLKIAIKDDLIDKNPASLIEQKKEMKWLSLEEIYRFLQVDTSEDPLGNVLKVSLLTGLRRGEVLALKWSDVDFEHNTLRVQRSLTRGEKSVKISTPKTEESTRVVPLPQIAIDIFKSQKAFQNEEKKKVGIFYKKKNFVFANPLGEHFFPDSLKRAITRVLKKANLPTVRIHDLRHSYASLLHQNGVQDKTIQKLLGHRDILTTMNTYVHSDEEIKKVAAQKIDNLIYEIAKK